MNFLSARRGFATIPTILALCALILVVAAGVATTTFTQTMTTEIEKESAAALRYAEAGARDGLIAITKDKKYTCASADCYSLDVLANGCANNDGCAKISVSAGTGSFDDPKIIISKGISLNKTREIEVRVFFDMTGYGEIENAVWKELNN